MRVLLLAFTGAFAFAAAFAVEGELDMAREALRDGLWSVARTHAAKVDTDEAKAVILESYAEEGDWKALAETLAKWTSVKGTAFDYYRAVVRGDDAAAMKLLAAGRSTAGVLRARMHAAEVMSHAGEMKKARAIWQDVLAQTNLDARTLFVASMNLGEVEPLRRAYAQLPRADARRQVGLRLGSELLKDKKTEAEGEKIIRTIVHETPDVTGAQEAFLALGNMAMARGDWAKARTLFGEALNIWPTAAKDATVQESMGWILLKLGQRAEALDAFALARRLATNDTLRASACAKEGDVLSEMGRLDEAMAKYRFALTNYPNTSVAQTLANVIKVRELEEKGRQAYRQFRFADAAATFRAVGLADSARKPRMDFYEALCAYGRGSDEVAIQQAEALAKNCSDAHVRAEALLWCAKMHYNRHEWKASDTAFAAASRALAEPRASEALLWSARAALAEGDYNGAVQKAADVVTKAAQPNLVLEAEAVQGEALIELSRFDEAMLILERVSRAETASVELRTRTQLLRADACFAIGADNPARYDMALAAYRAILLGRELSPDLRLVISFKIARTLDKLKRLDEALDQYYTQVVLAYREGRRNEVRFSDEACAAFSRAAFRLADVYESRGLDLQAMHILELVVRSDVPAADEAARRLKRHQDKGSVL